MRRPWIIVVFLLAVVIGGVAVVLIDIYMENQRAETIARNLASIETAHQAGRHSEVLELAGGLLEGELSPAEKERVTYLRAAAFEVSGGTQAIAAWEDLLRDYGDGAYARQALLALGYAGLETRQYTEARDYFRQALRKSATAEVTQEIKLALARVEQGAKNRQQAKSLLSELTGANTHQAVRLKAMKMLSDINRPALFASRGTWYNEKYRIRLGDKLGWMAGHWQTTVELIKKLNPNLNPNRIREGDIIISPKEGGVAITVDKSDLLLMVTSRRRGTEGEFLLSYRIGLPETEERKHNGDYLVSSDRRVYQPKENGEYGTLGSRYIKLSSVDPASEATRVGIHGASDASLIGKIAGKNSVRLTNPDIEELYLFAAPGTPVTIRD